MVNPAPSPVAAIAPAFTQMKKLLFSPFSAQRWLVLGFFSFLESMVGGGGANFNNRGGHHHGMSHPQDYFPAEKLQEFTGWAQAHLTLLLLTGAAAAVLIAALTVLCTWLSARGTFGHLDCIATGRYEVVQAWRGHAQEANSLFRWRLTFGLVALLLFVAITIPLGLSFWHLLNSGEPVTAEVLLFHSGFFLWLGAIGLLAFFRAYQLQFLRQFGPEFDCMAMAPVTAAG